jgi:hypothetical protein
MSESEGAGEMPALFLTCKNTTVNREEILRDDLKRTLICWQLMKYNMECIRTSDTIKEWAEEAKKNRNKNFVDLRIIAADQLRSLNATILKIKATMKPVTFNAIMSTLTSEQIHEINLLLNEVTELRENAISGITADVKRAKIAAGIPLNNSDEQSKVISDGKEYSTT